MKWQKESRENHLSRWALYILASYILLTIFLWFTFLYFYILVIVIIQNNYIHLELYLFSIFETKQWQSQRGKRALYLEPVLFSMNMQFDILILLRDKQTTRRRRATLAHHKVLFSQSYNDKTWLLHWTQNYIIHHARKYENSIRVTESASFDLVS